jgi:hypothetical protein
MVGPTPCVDPALAPDHDHDLAPNHDPALDHDRNHDLWVDLVLDPDHDTDSDLLGDGFTERKITGASMGRWRALRRMSNRTLRTLPR